MREGIIKPKSVEIVSCHFSDMFLVKTYKNIGLFYENCVFNITIVFCPENKIDYEIKYVEWYIKLSNEVMETKLKDMIYVDESYITVNYSDVIPFSINNFFCKKNGLRIRYEENYLIIPIMPHNLYAKDCLCIDIYLKPMVSPILIYESFWNASHIKIPDIKNQRFLPYILSGDFKNKRTAYVVTLCEYPNSYCVEAMRGFGQIDSITNLLDEWKEYNVNIKLKPKQSYILVIFSDFQHTNSKRFISRLLDKDQLTHVFELCRDASCRDASCRDASCRDASCRDTSCRDTSCYFS